MVPILRRYMRTGSTLRPRSSIRRGFVADFFFRDTLFDFRELSVLLMST
ncbi:hypothetical protein PPSIR1_03013 [Plesiocystis pacifica SIR-1]|uniref:Uncharacterized protein n=1 Tax=Plesiocystis pacifica SIR-1 TaxID=391625 RepID=A6G973_9BACT|nr:hypothetical protein PPSIR1_03013 [Plesiocystis pacifica SIR-1]